MKLHCICDLPGSVYTENETCKDCDNVHYEKRH